MNHSARTYTPPPPMDLDELLAHPTYGSDAVLLADEIARRRQALDEAELADDGRALTSARLHGQRAELRTLEGWLAKLEGAPGITSLAPSPTADRPSVRIS